MALRIRSTFQVTLIMMLLAATAVSTTAQTDDPASIPPPDSVTIAGTLQPAVGCSGEWNTTCPESQLVYDAEDDLWQATFELPAGSYEYKAALNGTWDDNYGLNAEYYGPNIPLEVVEETAVTFWYDHKTRWVSDNVNSLLANVPGDFQDEIGCPGDWEPDCLRSLLQDPNADGIYTFITALIPAGEYEAKVAVNQSWEINFGVDGVQDGANIPFSVAADQAVIFSFDPGSGILTIETSDEIPTGLITSLDQLQSSGGSLPPPAAPMPDLVVVPGTIQSVAGCDGDWQPDCEATALAFDEEDQLWQGTFDLPAGEYEYKVALNGSWDVNFGQNAEPGGANIPLALAEDTAVTFHFDHNSGWIVDNVQTLIANVPGDFQDEIGCPGDWQPDCLRSWLQDPDGDGTFVFRTLDIPAGEYEAKVAVDQSWALNYGEGGAVDGANIPFSVPEDGTLVTFNFDSRSNLLTIFAGSGGVQGNINELSAYWVTADTIAWDIEHQPGNEYFFHYDPQGRPFSLGIDGFTGGESVPLSINPDGLNEAASAKFPHLSRLTALTFSPDASRVPRVALKGQVAVFAQNENGEILNAAGLQIPGVLDDLYQYDGPLGVTVEDGIPTIRVWAPTARSVAFHLFPNSETATAELISPMRVDPRTGVWTIVGEPGWLNKYYLFEVEVFVPSEGSVQNNLVTDPYSVSLSINSGRSQIVDLTSPEWMPEGWTAVEKPPLDAPEDIIVYELHVRDFSVNDPTVPEEYQGTFKAFTVQDSNGMQHLAGLAEAGLTHLHLLPTFDIATIDEDKSNWVGPSFDELGQFESASAEQQALLDSVRDQDGFNWGYDPYHYNVPEGSYATDPNGPTRIVEFREMVQSLNETGLRLVIDVVYNHTNASGQNNKSVLDKIVPGYYHRLNNRGRVERSTCCENTATEHDMMRKLMIDSAVLWATAYKVDGFRFDLMGHHMKADMIAVREALDNLTLEEDGVDGTTIYIYGEGWNFGEVADNARGVNATQTNMAGTGIGTFNDRLRDGARGGSPFGGQTEQGFVTGLYTNPNSFDQGSDEEQRQQLLQFSDLIRIGLAGNLVDYRFINNAGADVNGLGVGYNGSPAGYTADPQENIVYISKHDNETLFDVIQYKAPPEVSTADRARMQTLGNSLVMLSQGIPFFQAGDDLLRSKSLDRNSYNSGDWFNRLDFSYQNNNFGVGLPPAADNQGMWEVMAPFLSDPSLVPNAEDIAFARDTFKEFIQIRQSTPLFRLPTETDVIERLEFHNTGPDQLPGLIVMSISDPTAKDIDDAYDGVVVLFNGTDESINFTVAAMAGLPYTLHPVQMNSVDPLLQEASFDIESGKFGVPKLTTAVFVLPQPETAETTAEVEAEAEAEPAETNDVSEAEETMEPVDEIEESVEEETTETETVEESGGLSNGLWAGIIVGVLGASGAAIYAARRRQRG